MSELPPVHEAGVGVLMVFLAGVVSWIAARFRANKPSAPPTAEDSRGCSPTDAAPE